jgi:GNAT superfamily N-acetyltransferase
VRDEKSANVVWLGGGDCCDVHLLRVVVVVAAVVVVVVAIAILFPFLLFLVEFASREKVDVVRRHVYEDAQRRGVGTTLIE